MAVILIVLSAPRTSKSILLYSLRSHEYSLKSKQLFICFVCFLYDQHRHENGYTERAEGAPEMGNIRMTRITKQGTTFSGRTKANYKQGTLTWWESTFSAHNGTQTRGNRHQDDDVFCTIMVYKMLSDFPVLRMFCVWKQRDMEQKPFYAETLQHFPQYSLDKINIHTRTALEHSREL